MLLQLGTFIVIQLLRDDWNTYIYTPLSDLWQLGTYVIMKLLHGNLNTNIYPVCVQREICEEMLVVQKNKAKCYRLDLD